MQVVVMNRVYRMNRKEYEGLLQVAREQIPFDAIEKPGYAELRCDKCSSMTQLKKLIRQLKAQGYKVLANTQVGRETRRNALGEVLESAV